MKRAQSGEDLVSNGAPFPMRRARGAESYCGNVWRNGCNQDFCQAGQRNPSNAISPSVVTRLRGPCCMNGSKRPLTAKMHARENGKIRLNRSHPIGSETGEIHRRQSESRRLLTICCSCWTPTIRSNGPSPSVPNALDFYCREAAPRTLQERRHTAQIACGPATAMRRMKEKEGHG